MVLEAPLHFKQRSNGRETHRSDIVVSEGDLTLSGFQTGRLIAK